MNRYQNSQNQQRITVSSFSLREKVQQWEFSQCALAQFHGSDAS